ncbi:MAG: cell division septal protein FtsQ [Myxococcota bacterium]|jgi:cell division septal protein FtsQ
MNRREGHKRGLPKPLATIGETSVKFVRQGLGKLAGRLRPSGNRRQGSTANHAKQTEAKQASDPSGRSASHSLRPLRALGIFALWALPMGTAAVAFATPLLGVKAYEYVMQNGHFHVREVLVEGNISLDLEAVREIAGIAPGTHVLDTDMDAVAARLMAHPWIRWASVERELPDRLMVTLSEHQPAAYLAVGELVLVDKRGEPFAIAEIGETRKLPIITGVDAADLENPTRRAGTLSDIRAALNVSRLYDAMGLSARWPLAELRVDPMMGIGFVLSEVGTEVRVGHGPYRDKLMRLEWVLESLQQDGKVAEYVVLDGHSTGSQDDGRVIVKADMAAGRRQLMRQAKDRAVAAERQALGLTPNPDIFGPALPPDLHGAPTVDDDEKPPSHPTLSGGRPAPLDQALEAEED